MVKNDIAVIEGLKTHFKQIHPVLFLRSQERAASTGNLFDILDTMPTEFPVSWDNEAYRWIQTDLLQAAEFEKKAKLCYHK